MDWYYAKNGQKVGPVDDVEFDRLGQWGVIRGDSLVWHSGMANWQPYRTLRSGGRALDYAGFWIRFWAYVVDGALIQAIRAIVLIPMGFRLLEHPWSWWTLADIGEMQFSSLAIALGYFAFFWTNYGATPGKMLFGLKIVTPEGGPISLGQAVGRYFSMFLSGIVMGIGFLMAAWDDEKRALHDRLAETRVIRERR